MNYQAICAAIELPLNNAFKGLTPVVKIFFDNLTIVPPDPQGEYVTVNITFGLVSESTLTENLDRARGTVIIRIFTPKNRGGKRARYLSGIASQVLSNLACTKKPATGTFVKVKQVSGPEFYPDLPEPHFMARIVASWDAVNLG